LADDVYTHRFKEGVIISPYAQSSYRGVTTGSKLLFFDSEDCTYLIKDEGKALDLVGGKVEEEESSLDCLMREVSEEIGPMKYDARRVCISSQLTTQHDFHSVVYLSPIDKEVAAQHPMLVRFSSCDYDYAKAVPWLPRLIDSLLSRAGGKSLGFPYLYASLPTVKYKLKRLVTSTLKGTKVVNGYRDGKLMRKGLSPSVPIFPTHVFRSDLDIDLVKSDAVADCVPGGVDSPMTVEEVHALLSRRYPSQDITILHVKSILENEKELWGYKIERKLKVWHRDYGPVQG